MKTNKLFLLPIILLIACTSNYKPDGCQITYVAVTPAGLQEEVVFICGEIRYLPQNGHVRCRFQTEDGQMSKDSIDFGTGTRIIPAEKWFGQ